MILILSKSKGDIETEDVMQWIKYFGKDVSRLNGDDLYNHAFCLSIDSSRNLMPSISFEEISTIWYRRYLSIDLTRDLPIRDKDIYHIIRQHLYSEFSKSYDNFLFKLKDVKSVSSKFSENLINKVNVLSIASSCDLDVPDTIITNEKKILEKFLEKHITCIVKPLSECILFSDNQVMFKMLTEKVNVENMHMFPNFFLPSLFQQYIPKLYELRVFYWFGQCYTMAIFSQESNQTKVDYRNYDTEKPNRNVPYQLPKIIEKRIDNLMKELKLETGSIDLIRTDDRYVFLEVNPNGQFGMVSYPCNYYLEEIIAKKLIHLDNDE